MQTGDKVRILAPFDKYYPGEYGVLAVFEDGSACVATPDLDITEKFKPTPNFDAKFLEPVLDKGVPVVDEVVFATLDKIEASKVTKASLQAIIEGAKDAADAAAQIAALFGVKE